VTGNANSPRDTVPLLSLTAAYNAESARLAMQFAGGTADLRLDLSLLPAPPLSSAM